MRCCQCLFHCFFVSLEGSPKHDIVRLPLDTATTILGFIVLAMLLVYQGLSGIRKKHMDLPGTRILPEVSYSKKYQYVPSIKTYHGICQLQRIIRYKELPNANVNIIRYKEL